MAKTLKFPKNEIAIAMYYEKTELSSENINTLFGGISYNTIAKLKRKVKPVMIERKIRTWQAQNVNTKIAFEVWGLDVVEMEKNHNKLKKLGLVSV